MREHLQRILLIILGLILILLGVAGLIFPIMPGWILLIPGVYLVLRQFAAGRRFMARLKRRYPRQAHWMEVHLAKWRGRLKKQEKFPQL